MDFGSNGSGSNPGSGATEKESKLHEDTVAQHEDSAPALAEMSDAWLVGRARELAMSSGGDVEGTSDTAVAEADRLLAEAQRRGEPRMVAQVLRTSCLVRLSGAHSPNETDPLLDEMIAHTRRHGLTVMEAGAHALRGRRFFLGGYEDEALTSAARALAILDEDLTPDTLIGVRSWTRLLSGVLVDIGQLLSQLGVYEIAAGVFSRAGTAIRGDGGPYEIAEHMINQTRLLLGLGPAAGAGRPVRQGGGEVPHGLGHRRRGRGALAQLAADPAVRGPGGRPAARGRGRARAGPARRRAHRTAAGADRPGGLAP